MIKIAVVFPVFNGLSYTKGCLGSLRELTSRVNPADARFEIVITDDGSSDGTGDWIRENYPEVHMRKGNGSLWWSGGINRAVQYAIEELNVDYTLWWNNDVKANDDFFINLVQVLKAQKEPVVTGSKVKIAQDPGIIWSMGGIFDPVSGFKAMIGSGESDGPAYKKPVECDWLTGMGTIVPAEVYKKIGMVDERFFPQYHGDSDFTFRAKKAGFKLMVQPDLIIYNDTSQTGLKHEGNLNRLYKTLTSIKSNYNITKDIRFYNRHTTSVRAYGILLQRYGAYLGGFFKWKVLGLFGKKRAA